MVASFQFRTLFAILGSCGMAIIYGFKVNLSVAIVAMINNTAIKEINLQVMEDTNTLKSEFNRSFSNSETSTLVCQTIIHENPKEISDSVTSDGPMTWTEPEQGLVLGSYFWGYFITQVPGGRLSELYGGKWVFWTATCLNILGLLLSPVCSYAGYQYLILMRIIMGLGAGVTFPAMNVLIAAWSPIEERSSISALVYGGTSLGTVLSIPTAGIIASTLGWEAVFYIHGGLSCIWLIVWGFFMSDTPETNRFITAEEKNYISSHQSHLSKGSNNSQKNKKIPWKGILTSIPFWALCISHVLNNFGWYMLLVELPLFLSSGLGFKISENALLSAIPFLANWIFSMSYGRFLDFLVNRPNTNFKTVHARKMSMAIASFIPAICLIGVTLSGCNSLPVIILMVIATCFYGSMFSGVFSNHTDIAPNYAGLLMGITNMAATIPGFVVPALVGALTHGRPGLAPWHTVFYITAGLLGIELVIFSCFASGEEQAWNKSNHETLEDGHGDDNEENQIELQMLSSGSPASLDDKSINQAFFDITCNSKE